MAERLKGKVVLITGGASGIGEATARLFNAEGAQVVISDIDRLKGQALAEELAADFVYADVTREADVAAAVKQVAERFGRLDCMINNAGMIGAVGSLLETSFEDWQRTMDVLLNSVFFGIKHAGRLMKEQGGGVILSLSSLAGVCSGMGPHAYSVAKHGVNALTRTAASEFSAYRIRVNSVAPGMVTTPLVDQVFGGDRQAALEGAAQSSPLGSAIYPREIAASLLYLASDEAAHVTAQTLVIDSGVSTAGSSASALFHGRPAGVLTAEGMSE